MNIRGFTVCVDYADLLDRGLDRWHTGLDKLIVITSSQDHVTQKLCASKNIECYVTDVFYANGASFNKGAAMSEAVERLNLKSRAEWLLVFDSDIVPPENWRMQVERLNAVPGGLYGALRYWQPEDAAPLVLDLSKRMPQSWVLGFFMLFHAKDPVLPDGPMFDIHWPHAGNFDTKFCRLWPKDKQVITSIPFIHLGEERMNWCGRHRREELMKVLKQRQGWEDWEREKMKNPPEIRT